MPILYGNAFHSLNSLNNKALISNFEDKPVEPNFPKLQLSEEKYKKMLFNFAHSSLTNIIRCFTSKHINKLYMNYAACEDSETQFSFENNTSIFKFINSNFLTIYGINLDLDLFLCHLLIAKSVLNYHISIIDRFSSELFRFENLEKKDKISHFEGFMALFLLNELR